MTTPHGLGYVKMVIMVDEDVDPFNLPQVMWALSSRSIRQAIWCSYRICLCSSLTPAPARRDH